MQNMYINVTFRITCLTNWGPGRFSYISVITQARGKEVSREFSNSSDVVEENRHEGIYTAFRCICEQNMESCQLCVICLALPNFQLSKHRC